MLVLLRDSVLAVLSGPLGPLQTEARQAAMCQMPLEVHLPGERESEIDDESWVQSPGSLPGMTNKLCDAKNHFFCIF